MVPDTRILHTDMEDIMEINLEGILDMEALMVMVMGIQGMVLIMEDMLIPLATTQG